MNMAKLQQDILRCQEVIGEIMIKHYDTNSYKEMVERIFKEIFKDYFTGDYKCPDKLEPKSGHLPEESLKKIRDNLRINNN
jgi:hypothetical protein